VESARTRAAELGFAQVSFEVSELDDIDPAVTGAPFDAVIGRFILMHQRDPAAVLAGVSRLVRPGGRVVMVESWMELLRAGGHSQPTSELYHEIVEWSCRVVEGAGADLASGGRLRETFERAGLGQPECRMDALIAGGEADPYYEYVEQSIRSMLPEAARLGLEGFTPRSAEGIGARLEAATVASAGSLVGWPVVAAIGQVPL
jgi:SAM-dependent methyltransferase